MDITAYVTMKSKCDVRLPKFLLSLTLKLVVRARTANHCANLF